MAAGINKIDNVYATEWYKEHVLKAERGNREHLARFDRSFNGVMAKAGADGGEKDNKMTDITKAHQHRGPHELGLSGKLEPADSGHPYVGDEKVDMVFGEEAQSLIAIRRRENDAAGFRQDLGDDGPYLGLVVDDEDRFQRRRAQRLSPARRPIRETPERARCFPGAQR